MTESDQLQQTLYLQLGEVRGTTDGLTRRIDRLENKLDQDLASMNGKIDLILSQMATTTGAFALRRSIYEWVRVLAAGVIGTVVMLLVQWLK